MRDIKEIHFGETIKIVFPDGDAYYMPSENIAEIVSEYWQVQNNELLCPSNTRRCSIEVSEVFEKRKKMAEEYIKEHDKIG